MKTISKELEKYSNKELIALIKNKSHLYYKLIDSETKASEILNNYNRPFYKRNEHFKIKYRSLLNYAKRRGINTTRYENKSLATDKDIIARICENCYEEINRIDDTRYKYNGYCGNLLWIDESMVNYNDETGADIMMTEIQNIYDNIVDEVVDKHLTKKALKKKLTR